MTNAREPFRLKWSQKSRKGRSIFSGSTTLVGDSVYFFGERGECSVLSCATWKWHRVKHFPWKNMQYFSSVLIDDKIFLFGGVDASQYNPDTLVFDVVTRTFDLVDRSHRRRRASRMAVVFSDLRQQIVCFGGICNHELLNSTYVFDKVGMDWKELRFKGPLPPPRASPGAAIESSKLFVYGGFISWANYLSDLWIADLDAAGRPFWTKPEVQGKVPNARCLPAFNVVQGRFVLFGGLDGASKNGDFCVYFRDSREWKWPQKGGDVELHRQGGVLVKSIGNAVQLSDGVLSISVGGVFKLEPELPE